MAKTTPAEFIQDKVTQLRALTWSSNSRLVFTRVMRSAHVDIDRIVATPTFPCAVLHLQGGTLDSANGEIWNKSLGITIVVQASSDVVLDAAHEQLDLLQERLIDALQDSQADDAIICVFESEEQSAATQSISSLVWKTLIFAFSIDRTIPVVA